MTAGVLLWIPALEILPGTKRLSLTARAAYVFVLSFLVTGLSFVWVLARHSLYLALGHQSAIVHMSPLLDQRVAGFAAELLCYVPMWAVAFTMFSRAEERGIPAEETPLHWADVERELLRVDRQRA